MLETENHDYKIHQLPLARIKKVMKADPEVKMISAEAPIPMESVLLSSLPSVRFLSWDETHLT